MSAGTGGYAKGHNALGICERCAKKMLRRNMVYDGQIADLLVCPECWDPKHPQEYLPPVTDKVTIYDPTGDPEAQSANTQVINFPPRQDSLTEVNPVLNPLSIGLLINQGKFNFVSGPDDAVGEIPGPSLVGNAPGDTVVGVSVDELRPPLPGAGADPDVMGSIEEGMLMMCYCAADQGISSVGMEIDSGWNRLYNPEYHSAANGAVALFWKIATASEVAPTIDMQGFINNSEARMWAYSNVDQDNPFADAQAHFEISVGNTNFTASQLSWLTARLPFLFGDKVVSLFYEGTDVTQLTSLVAPTPTTVLKSGSSPIFMEVGHWDTADNLEVANLLETSDLDNALDGFTVVPMAASIGDYDYQGASGKGLDYFPSAEMTYVEKSVPVVLGQNYWFGVYHGSSSFAGTPDFAAISVDDGTDEDGFIYANCDRNSASIPEFHDDIGAGQAIKFTNFQDGRGTMTMFRWTATITGSVTYRVYMTGSSSSLVHSTNMTGNRLMPILGTWVCDASLTNPLMPTFPPHIGFAAGNYFAPLFWSAATRPVGNSPHNTFAIVIRGAGNAPNPSVIHQWPGSHNAEYGGNINRRNGPSASRLSTTNAEKAFGAPVRQCDSGKFYFEIKADDTQPIPTSNASSSVGIVAPDFPTGSHVGQGFGAGNTAQGIGLELDGGHAYRYGVSKAGLSMPSIVAGDVLGLAVDFDNDTIDYYVNNVFDIELMGIAGTDVFDDERLYAPCMRVGSNNQAFALIMRLKAADFTYTPPVGFSAWSGEV